MGKFIIRFQMAVKKSQSQEAFWAKDPFGIIKPEEFEALGITPSDITPGTLAAHRHPPLLSSRFGGNAYGFGFFEIYDHLEPDDLKLIQSITFDNQDHIKRHFSDLNRIYKKIGLLIRFTSFGKPYYLIPAQLVSESVKNIKDRADEMSKVIDFHSKKYQKANLILGILTHEDDPIVNDLALRFKEHSFKIINSPEKLESIKEPLDMVILTRDIYRTILLEKLRRTGEVISGDQLERHALYTIGKIYKVLKPDGELFIIANSQPVKTNQTAQITFNTLREKKRFLIFTHVFKTDKRYRVASYSVTIKSFDLERYLSIRFLEQEIIDRLSGGRDLEKMSLREIDELPYLNISLINEFAYDQRKEWLKILPVYFNGIFHKPLVGLSVTAQWKKRFSIKGYSPDYMLIYLGQKKRSAFDIAALKKDVSQSNLAGSPLSLLADYRDTFDYLLECLNLLNSIKTTDISDLPEVFMERLKEPFENKLRRHANLNDVIKLMSKTAKLERIKSIFNPDTVEGPKTRVLENIELLPFFGLTYGELREIILIIAGHTTGERILSGKMNEKTLKPLTEIAKALDRKDAINLLRYCRLMSMSELMASRKTGANQKHLAELFDLFELPFKIVTNQDMDWDTLLDEKISAAGGIHNKLVRKLLMMMNRFEFLDNWAELIVKGEMERDVLANYDKKKTWEIDGILDLVRVLDRFKNRFLKDDPLLSPVIYRKFLNAEFHGTGQIFERMDSQLVFILLWLAVNISRGDIVNFNPILANSKFSEIEGRVKRVEEDSRSINRDRLDIATLKKFSKELYENGSAFFVNTGFRFRVNKESQSLDIYHIDLDEKIEQFELLAKRFSGRRISEFEGVELEEMEKIFADLEDFYRSHKRMIAGSELVVPDRQKRWFSRVEGIRNYLKTNFISAIFEPEDVYTDLDMLLHHAPSLLHFALPELMTLQDMSLSGKIYLRSPILDHILACTRKIQALIRGDSTNFQDVQALHKLAQREFGPMAAGIIGFNESQIEELMSIVAKMKENPDLLDAVVKTFIFHDLGLNPSLMEKYKDEVNRADQAQAGALFIIKEGIPSRYGMSKEAKKALVFLIRSHDWILHLIWGDYSYYSLLEIMDECEEYLFDAFFVTSLLITSALNEGSISEDLASRLLMTRNTCRSIIKGETSFDDAFKALFIQKGRALFALEEYNEKGIPDATTPSEFLESWSNEGINEDDCIEAGKIIASIERIFRLRGVRSVEFNDLAKLIVKVPTQYIYRKRNYFSVGSATFEKDLSEALNIYEVIRTLPEKIRTFMLGRLIADKVRIYGFENVGINLSHGNMIKLLLIALLGSQRFARKGTPISLDFLDLAEKIDKRHDAVDDFLNNIPIDQIWGNRQLLNRFLKSKSGITLEKNDVQRVLVIDFIDRIQIRRKISHMDKINDIDQVKAYYHYTMQSLKSSPFYTEDYETLLEESFKNRLREITDLMIDNTKIQMDGLTNLREIDHLYADLINKSLAIEFSEDQKHRLNDLYELKKDGIREEKLKEIDGMLDRLHDLKELRDLWDKIKIYMMNNRQFLGKEFESTIAGRFDETAKKIKDMSFQVHFMT
jgi:hypothetical protein